MLAEQIITLGKIAASKIKFEIKFFMSLNITNKLCLLNTLGK